MLYPTLLISALQERREEFVSYANASNQDALEYAESLCNLSGTPAKEIAAMFQSPLPAGVVPDALPTDELDSEGSVSISFDRTWRSHEEARRWAVGVLQNRITFAVDGSQISPGREVSLPLAAVQIAWFENPHTADGKYTKQARLEILSPEQLRDSDGQLNPEKQVVFHRTRMEIEKVSDFIVNRKGWRKRGERVPIAFFDGSLAYLLSVALPNAQRQYGNAIKELVRLSEEMEVPVVGFVDHSYARELVKLVDALHQRERPGARFPYNSQILRAASETTKALLSGWGDRTIFFSFVPPTPGYQGETAATERLLGFCYLQTTGESLPARLDIPCWVFERGLLGEVIDIVRAECVVGIGYPYAIETADEAAVISVRDRDLFLRTFQDFAENNGLGFRVSRKAMSKAHRR
jgi:hypothetical protein